MVKTIKPQRLAAGDTAGLIAPCCALKKEDAERPLRDLKRLGFKVKLAANLFNSDYGYAAPPKLRADDFNAMITDREVAAVLFEGGEVCNEILPLIDYKNIAENPKIICGYSDGTTLLNAVYRKTGLVTFYGPSPGSFAEINDYSLRSFKSRLTGNFLNYEKAGEWTVIRPGAAEGTLIGGYLANVAMMQKGGYFRLRQGAEYLLFIEDHEFFSPPARVSAYFSHLEQNGIFSSVKALIFGHYSEKDNPQITGILSRIGERYNIPVVKNNDFGHGKNKAVLPIGIRARLDTRTADFSFLESGVK